MRRWHIISSYSRRLGPGDGLNEFLIDRFPDGLFPGVIRRPESRWVVGALATDDVATGGCEDLATASGSFLPVLHSRID